MTHQKPLRYRVEVLETLLKASTLINNNFTNTNTLLEFVELIIILCTFNLMLHTIKFTPTCNEVALIFTSDDTPMTNNKLRIY